jgi:hypothetical protein
MTMYFPTAIVTGPGAAYVFLLYGVQLVWTIGAAGVFLVGDRGWRTALSHTPVLTSEPPPSMGAESLEGEAAS